MKAKGLVIIYPDKCEIISQVECHIVMDLEVGDSIVATYNDNRKFVGVISTLEHQDGEWSDGNPNGLNKRTMIRIQTSNGGYQSFWLDKCVSVEKN